MKRNGILFAILAAVLYAVSSPYSKILLKEIPSSQLAGWLYLGAGIGVFIVLLINKSKLSSGQKQQPKLDSADLKYVIGMVLLDIAAPVSLLYGLNLTTAANAALLNNFEIVATALIAFLFLKEKISPRLWFAIVLVTAASVLLSYNDISSLSFGYGSLFVLLACIFWGFENNCTRKLSSKNPLQIVVIKGFGSGIGALIIGIFVEKGLTLSLYILPALLLGFFSYGLSVTFYIYAQRLLGAAKTSTFYAFAPFAGAIFSIIFLREKITVFFLSASIIMLIGALLAAFDEVKTEG